MTAAPWWAARRHPVWTAVGLAAAPVLVTAVVAGLGSAVSPSSGDDATLVLRLVAVLVLMLAVAVVVGRAHAWRRVGAGGRTTWRSVPLLAVPAIVALAPFATGLALPSAPTLLVLVSGYAATGVFEELWHRGVVQDALRGVGLRRAAVVGGALFAASHLANILFGQPVAISAAQSVGAFCFGVGFSVLRWRTDAVWLLAAIHALGDLSFKVTNLHGGELWATFVAHDTAMLLWGLWVLRGLDDDLGPVMVASEPGGRAAFTARRVRR